MAGPKTLSRKKSGGVQGRNVEATGAPLQVSDDTSARNISSPKIRREFGGVGHARTELAQRPSTAGGSSSRRPLYKHETRDDLHCGPLTSNQFPTTHFDFPLPASILTPAATPKSSRSPATSPEPEFGGHRRPEEIGMAFGSPTQNTAVWSPHVHFQASPRRYTPESLEDWAIAPPPKSKSSKWKILGGLFGKKTSGPPTAFYQLQPEEYRPDPLAFPPPPPENRGRGGTTSERKLERRQTEKPQPEIPRTEKPKPDIKRANTVPIDFQFQESSDKSREFPLNAPLQSNPLKPPRIHIEGGSLLNVEIPTVELERYSVMFGDLIEPSHSSTSSLLARRQATLDKLKVVNEKLAQHGEKGPGGKAEPPRPRRATSPQPTSSPSMSLFPPPLRTQRDGSTHAPQKPSPLHRSNTSPAALSPSRPTFEPPNRTPPRPEVRPVPPPKGGEHVTMRAPSAASLRPTATLTGPWSAESSFLFPLSPSSMVSEMNEEEEDVEDVIKPHQKEPVWEMITPAPISKFNAVQGAKSVKNPIIREAQSTDSLRKQPLQSSLDALAHAGATAEADKIIETAANISIARQISVSRQQRQLLVRVRSNANTTNRPKKAVDEKLVVSDKSMTPKIVNMRSRRVDSEQVVFDRATIYQA